MTQYFSSPSNLRRIGARVCMGAGLLVALAGVYAYRTIGARPGEASLRFVPADALLAGSIDLSASASQAAAFKKIDDALARNNMAGLVEKSLIDLFESEGPGADALRPLTTRNMAVAVLPGPDGTAKDAKGLALVNVSDGAAAQAALEKFGAPRFFKGAKYFKLKNGRSFYFVEGNTLIVGEAPMSIYKARQVMKGEAPAITADARFAGAKTHISDDANVMVFLSPKMFSGSDIPNLKDVTSDWMAMGIAIRDGGIGLSYGGVMDLSKEPTLAKMGQIGGVRSDVFRMLPSGAYGATILSQPAGYFESTEGMLRQNSDNTKALAEMEDSLTKETGMDFRKDVLPAFKGNVVLAAYPRPGIVGGGELLLIMDESNGADPANAVDRFRNWVQRRMEKEGKQEGPLWVDAKANNAQIFRLSDKVQGDVRKSLGNGIDADKVQKDVLVNHKTITWAVVGRAVIAATDEELLARALQSYQNGTDSIGSDPKYGSVTAELADGSQQISMFSLSRIAEGVKNTFNEEKMDKEGRQIFESVLSAFSTLDQPLTLKARIQPDGRVSAGLFIPLDYDKVLDFAGKMMEHQHPSSGK